MNGKLDRSKLIRLIHIAKSRLGLSDGDYRAILESTAKKSSCSEMTVLELDGALRTMKMLGFRVKKLETKKSELGWNTSKEQMDYIKGMWELVARNKSDRALYRFINRITGAEHPRFMTEKNAQDVILALRAMMVKAGFNPDYKESVGGK